MKVMLDTNILVSAFVFKSSIMNELLDVFFRYHSVYICSYTFDELLRLMREKFFITGDKDFFDISIKHPKILTASDFLKYYS